jgi:hypothetical protein
MEATQAMPKASPNLEARKLNLIEVIARISDPDIITRLEDFLQDDAALSSEEVTLLEKRLARYRANPRQTISIESTLQKLANRSR